MPVDRFTALANPTRRLVLAGVRRSGRHGETVRLLAERLRLPRPLVSYHLARLVTAGLVVSAADPDDARRRRYVSLELPAQARDRSTTSPTPAPASGGRPEPGSADPGPRHGSIIGGLSPHDRERLEPFIERRQAEAGTVLFWQGDPPSGLWSLETGAVRIFAADAEGRQQTLQVLRAGESFNEVPFFDGGPQPAGAEVVERALLRCLPFSRREAAQAAVPALPTLAAAGFAARLRQTVALVADLSFRHVTGRVARVLLQAVEPHPGVGAGSGPRLLTQREMADMVGTSREVVARSLHRLEEEGLIRVERGRITILDPGGLASRD